MTKKHLDDSGCLISPVIDPIVIRGEDAEALERIDEFVSSLVFHAQMLDCLGYGEGGPGNREINEGSGVGGPERRAMRTCGTRCSSSGVACSSERWCVRGSADGLWYWLWTIRVDPVEAAESSEIAVERTDACAVLDGKRGEMCVRHKVPAQVPLGEQATEDVPVASSRCRHPGQVGIQPIIDVAPRFLGSQRVRGYARMSHDALERHQRCPRESDTLNAVHRFVQPRARSGVKVGLFIYGVEQHVGVNDHWMPSASN